MGRGLQRAFITVQSRQKDKSARLVTHQLLQCDALLAGELAFLHPHIAEKNDIILGEFLILRK